LRNEQQRFCSSARHRLVVLVRQQRVLVVLLLAKGMVCTLDEPQEPPDFYRSLLFVCGQHL
jgi:hypothetical protein